MSKLIVFENPEKKGHEKWTAGRDMMNIIFPYRLLIVGKPNRGKTNIIKNLIYYAIPKFKRIFLLHATSGNENTQVPPDYKGFNVELLNEIPDISFWDDYADEKVLLVVDDYNLKSNKKRLNLLERTFGFVSTHRGVSCILALQNGFDPLSLQFRRHCNIFIFFKTEDEKYNKRLAETGGLSKDKINEIFKKYKFGIHSSLWIDFTQGTPYSLRVITNNLMKIVNEKIEPLVEVDKRVLRFDRFKGGKKYKLNLFTRTVH